MPTPDPTVDISDVRAALQEIDADAIPDRTIQSAIDDTEIIVKSRLPHDWEGSADVDLPENWAEMSTDEQEEWKQKRVDLITKHAAKRRAFNSSGAEVRVQALDGAVSLDIQAFRGQLRRDVEQAWATLGYYEGGSSAAFVDATEHAPGGGTEERLNRDYSI